MFENILWICSTWVISPPLYLYHPSGWENISFFHFRGISEPVGFWKQYCCLLTCSISLQIQIIEVFLYWGTLDGGPPLVKRGTFERNVWQHAMVEGHLEQWIVFGYCQMWTMPHVVQGLWCFQGRTALTFWLCDSDQNRHNFINIRIRFFFLIKKNFGFKSCWKQRLGPAWYIS